MKKFRLLIVDDDLEIASFVASHVTCILSKGEEMIRFGRNEILDGLLCPIDTLNGDLLIDVAYNVKDASGKLKDNIYSAIILDGNLPNGEHGRDILKLMNPEQKAVTIISSGDNHFLIEAEKQNIQAMSKSDGIETLKRIFVSMGLI